MPRAPFVLNKFTPFVCKSGGSEYVDVDELNNKFEVIVGSYLSEVFPGSSEILLLDQSCELVLGKGCLGMRPWVNEAVGKYGAVHCKYPLICTLEIVESMYDSAFVRIGLMYPWSGFDQKLFDFNGLFDEGDKLNGGIDFIPLKFNQALDDILEDDELLRDELFRFMLKFHTLRGRIESMPGKYVTGKWISRMLYFDN